MDVGVAGVAPGGTRCAVSGGAGVQHGPPCGHQLGPAARQLAGTAGRGGGGKGRRR